MSLLEPTETHPAASPPSVVERVHESTATNVFDWDKERGETSLPRRIEVPPDATTPTWLVVPHARYVLCARHQRGRVETVYVASLIGKRDSLIPAGAVDSISMDERSATVVIEGRPYLYAVDPGTTLDLLSRRVLGAG
ncbi:MAG TPA: hypothetical protein VND21_04830 [Planctomycetota bacterium]|nr:hypothetical protein [Planctomycetota bacterium]